MDSFYSFDELKKIGFKKIGKDVLISRKCSIYGAEHMSIGNCVRIDDFCILSGKISIGNHVHIAAYSALFAGDAGIVFNNFACISARCTLFAVSDDYSGEYLTCPTVPLEYRGLNEGHIELKECALVGSGCTILPGVIIGEGTSVGSMSLLTKSLDSWGIYAGIPCKRIKERKKNILKLKEDLLSKENYGR
jgi:galactoside O-acetyltransferase